MSKLTSLHKPAEASPENMSLADILDELCKYGCPMLVMADDDGEWYCRTKMMITSAGASFYVKSEYNHKTHISAAQECLDRVRQAVADIRGDGVKA